MKTEWEIFQLLQRIAALDPIDPDLNACLFCDPRGALNYTYLGEGFPSIWIHEHLATCPWMDAVAITGGSTIQREAERQTHAYTIDPQENP